MSPTDTLAPADPALITAPGKACANIGTRATDRLDRAQDASHYLLTPYAVANARDTAELGAVIAVGRARGIPVTFRSGGTNLSGPSGTDGGLINTRKNSRRITVLDGGHRVRTQPAPAVRAVNTRYGTRARLDALEQIGAVAHGARRVPGASAAQASPASNPIGATPHLWSGAR